jgi:hypothetical protein
VKNKLKYRLTLYATSTNTETPVVTQVLLKAATESDTGVTEGTLEAWNNPLLTSDTISYGFGAVKSRYEGIAKIQAITRQDIYVDGQGELSCLNHRGSTLSRTFNVRLGATGDIKVLRRREEREPMANCIQVLGSGLEDGGITLIPKSIYEDATSITSYGRIEKKFNAKDINDQAVLNAYTYSLLQRMKDPYVYVEAIIVDLRTRDWNLGDTVTVTDGTLTTGQNGALRITDETRNMSTAGEEVSITFSTRDMDDETIVKEFLSQINSFMGLPQASAVLAYAHKQDDCDHDHPMKLHVWIDLNAELKAMDLSVWTEKFRSTSTGAASGGGSTSGGGSSHSHTVTVDSHTHGFAVPQHSHGVTVQDATSSFPLYSINGGSGIGCSGGGTITTGNTAIASLTTSGGGSSTPTSSSETTHTHTTPAHVHDLVFGMFEYANAAAVKCFINDPTYSTPVAAFGTRGSAAADGTFELINLSLLQYYDPDGSGVGKLGPGSNIVEIVPQADPSNNPEGLLRIEANVRPKFKT